MEDVYLNNLIKLIKAEVAELPKQNKHYNIDEFTKRCIIYNTSKTLLKFVSRLVSKDTITRESFSISPSIQAHITKIANQTTLGLAIKLYHRFRSKELISLLHEYGYLCTYDEVLRFRTSVSKYVREKDYTARGLQRNAGIIASWCDNYDLQVNTPNGQRETHSMAIEWRQQQCSNLNRNADELDGPLEPRSLIVPRLTKEEAKNVKVNELAAVTILCYKGLKKPIPPKVICNNVGDAYDRVVARVKSVQHAVRSDVDWLASTIKGDKDGNIGVDWLGYNFAIAREEGTALKATKYIFGPLINETPSHPDTILTTMALVEDFVTQHGQKYSYVEADMQIYKIAIHIKWSNIYCWRNMIIRPGGMHTLMSFIGCIGVLMSGTGLQNLLSTAFNGVPNMLNGKA